MAEAYPPKNPDGPTYKPDRLIAAAPEDDLLRLRTDERGIVWEVHTDVPHRYIQGRVGAIWAFTIDLGGRGPTLHPKLPAPDGARDFEGPFLTLRAAKNRAGDILAEFLQQLQQESW